jgi:S-layer protein (TIGR01567 family)
MMIMKNKTNKSLAFKPFLLLIAVLMLTSTVMAANNSTGNRIWDADENLSLEYTWTALTYSGFYYDLDSGEGSETLTITLDSDSDRSIGEGDLEYSTKPIDTDFEYGDWGSYQVIGFMAERYFAGYTDDTDFADDSISLISDGILSEVLIDADDKISLFGGSSLELEEGYELEIDEVDLNGDSVMVTLTQDGDDIDTSIVSSNDEYIYEKELGTDDEVPIIVVHFENIFQGTESNAVFIEGIFQISEDYIELESGDSYGKMEIDSLSSDEITMENSDSISLGKGNTISIMGKLNFIVADDSTLRFGPELDMSDEGTYELRGTVAEDEELTWTPLNFEGFYYNLDEGVGTESLEIEDLSGRTIDDGDLVYKSKPLDVSFEYDDWGEFQVIGFMSEKYFAGYPDNEFTDDVSLLSDGYLSKVLIDDDSKTSLFAGSSLELEDGYEIQIVEVDLNGDDVMISLRQDGDDVDTGIVSADDDYVYEKDIGDVDDVPIIVLHFASIFQGTESNAVFIEGMFQISEDLVEISSDETFGKMEVTSFSSDEIILENEDSITLSRGNTIDIMGDISFKVADDGDVRYYPFVEISTVPTQSLSIDIASTLKEDEEVDITVTSRGAAVSGAVVMFDDEEIGKTSTSGTISYTPRSSGTFEVTAEKDGYVSASEEVEVIAADDVTRKLAIEVSPDTVVDGDDITIYIMTAIGGEYVEDVDVYYDGKLIGTTDSDGSVEYTVTDSGIHEISTSADEYLSAEINLEVLELQAEFSYTNLQVTPLVASSGEDITVTVNVENTGTEAGDTDVELLVNGTTVSTQSVSLNAGEETTVTFTIAEEEAGTYEAQVGSSTATFEVEKSTPGPGIVVSVMAFIAVAMLIRRKENK